MTPLEQLAALPVKIDNRCPRGGWADGHYLRKCFKCQSGFVGDKRAISCADCAYDHENQSNLKAKQFSGKMRTPEEWSKEFSLESIPINTIDRVQRIQLDAWCQGMTDAAMIVVTERDYGASFGCPPDLIAARDYIIKAREDRIFK